MPTVTEYQWARQRRTAIKSSGGVLDMVMPLRVTGTAPPLFCAPPVVGLSWCYTSLLPFIGADIPVYGLQVRGLRRPEPLPATMPEMAREFADRVRLTQPEGPYHLLGWSLGGIMAHATAEELERRGHEVALLAILDAYPENPSLRSDDQIVLLYDIVLSDFGYPPDLKAGDDNLETRVLEIVRALPGRTLDDWSDERILSLLRIIRNNVAISAVHRPGRLRAGLTFFSATQTEPELAKKLSRWRPFVGDRIESIDVDCRHEHLMLPGPAECVGKALTERIAATTTLASQARSA